MAFDGNMCFLSPLCRDWIKQQNNSKDHICLKNCDWIWKNTTDENKNILMEERCRLKYNLLLYYQNLMIQLKDEEEINKTCKIKICW